MAPVHPYPDRSPDAWLRRFRPVAAPQARILCLPHGGGTAAAYRAWPDAVPEDVEVVVAQYPGRHDRLTEPVVADMDEMAARLAAAVTGLTDCPLIIFGHSMGASIGYELTLRLPVEAQPRMLVVSGHPAPHRRTAGRALHRLDDEEMLTAVAELGGMYEIIRLDPDLRDLVLAPLRADLALMERYQPEPSRRLDIPVTACFGAADPAVDRAQVAAWAELTTGPFTLREFPGGHFYLDEHRSTLIDEMLGRARR
ncbi:alpha/beta fold hydrolase [Actinoplanes sp. NPDC049802]|uniref:thioesterase II family protein n=1 Tax=Actinoplanes sp. NPDC049802 TaxID=3154742 RepID=UPI0033CFCDBC